MTAAMAAAIVRATGSTIFTKMLELELMARAGRGLSKLCPQSFNLRGRLLPEPHSPTPKSNTG